MERSLRMSAFVAALAALAAGPAAAAVSTGANVASLGLGVGIPLSGLDLSRFGGGSEAPGGAGVAVSPQFLHYIDPHVGVGGELTYASYSDRDVVRAGQPDLTVGGSLLDLEAVAQYLVSPEARVSPYLVGGLGLSRFSANVHETRDPGDVLLDSDSTGLALSLGAGVQAGITDSLVFLGDLRWHLATTDSSAFGTGVSNALAVLLRLGWRL